VFSVLSVVNKQCVTVPRDQSILHIPHRGAKLSRLTHVPARFGGILDDVHSPGAAFAARTSRRHLMGWKIAALGSLVVIGGCLTAAAIERGPAKTASDFTLYSTRGKMFHLADLQGKPVVIDFWASWCGPCRSAIPVLERIHQDFKERGVVVLGINVHDNQNPAQTMQDLGATYPALIEGDAVAKSYGVEGLPTVIVIGADGQVLYRETGFSSIMEARIGEVLEKELARSASLNADASPN
jgi:thiol-disulfide isomerase/thioredoxin